MGCSGCSSGGLTPLEERYINRRPPLGRIQVVDVSPEPIERKILAASLQGLINRSEVRLYLVGGTRDENRPWETDGEAESARFWIEHYRSRGIAWFGDEMLLDDALARFAGEVERVYVVSASELWTVTAATSMAAMQPGLVVFDSDLDRVRPLLPGSAGLTDLRGRWGSEPEVNATVGEWLAEMDQPRLAILAPSEYRLRDFLIQQGIVAAFGRPTTDTWPSLTALLPLLRPLSAVFGYVADNAVQEFLGVKALSEAGLFLVPTDTTSNLSVHVAVLPASGISNLRSQIENSGGACDPHAANVLVAISDGDNLTIPLNRYTWSDYWPSPKRGRLPLGWSLGLSLRTLAPAAADYYLSTASTSDEWVSMVGLGYALPSYHQFADPFLNEGFALASELGIRSTWFLDVPLLSPGARMWATIADRLAPYPDHQLLVGYLAFPGQERMIEFAPGRRALLATNQYEDTPEVLAQRVREYLNTDPSARAPVLFLSASVWSNRLDGLVDALTPLASEGARFLTPSSASACLGPSVGR
ncbi:MAG: hypothetical protein HYY13_03580 [Nitrospirae bacterium]|nr:hypothetical protein [Nitrospirota bacterium]